MKSKTTKTIFFGLVLTGSLVHAQSTCNNLDFENSDYTGWSTFKGANLNSLAAPSSVVSYTNPSTTGANVIAPTHCLINGAGLTDPTTTVALTPPYGGNNIVRVNHIGTGAEVGILERQVAVSISQPYVNFSYFVVFENAGHTTSDQPYFRFNVLDATNTAIPSASLNIVAGTGTVNPGFVQVGNFFYKPWTPVAIDLSAYAGQTVTLQFIAADCIQGGHGGYAYVDLDCNASSPVVANVWPGDANYDLAVNYLDLFYVGAGYGQTGPARTTPGNTWAAAPSNDWGTQSFYLLDAKHADCNGNGTIDAADTTAISLNYGLNHPFKNPTQLITVENSAALESIRVVSSNNTVNEGQNFHLDFEIGNTTDPIDSIYAVGFTLNYPASLFDGTNTAMINSSSVVGTNLLYISKPTSQTIDMAVTRNNHQNAVAVSGKAFSLNLKAKASFYADTTVQFTLSNIKAVTKSGYKLQFSSAAASVEFKKASSTGIKTMVDASNIVLFPNPSHDKLTLSLPSGMQVQAYKVYSVMGQELISNSAKQGSNIELNVSELANGLYIIKLFSEDGNHIEKRFMKN
ncbi:MAG: T9SS type A sorting domain-containing protein [Bacteroidota bacterium]